MKLSRRIRAEARQVGLVILYFFVAFLLIFTLKMLYLAEHAIGFPAVAKALVGALLVGKVVVVLEKTAFGSRFRHHSVAVDVAYRSSLYTAAIMVVLSGERIYEGYGEAGHLVGAWSYALETADLMRFFGNLLGVYLAFVGYNLLSALATFMGRERLILFLFSRRGRHRDRVPSATSTHPDPVASDPDRDVA